jgi:hypothetical protein
MAERAGCHRKTYFHGPTSLPRSMLRRLSSSLTLGACRNQATSPWLHPLVELDLNTGVGRGEP